MAEQGSKKSKDREIELINIYEKKRKETVFVMEFHLCNLEVF